MEPSNPRHTVGISAGIAGRKAYDSYMAAKLFRGMRVNSAADKGAAAVAAAKSSAVGALRFARDEGQRAVGRVMRSAGIRAKEIVRAAELANATGLTDMGDVYELAQAGKKAEIEAAKAAKRAVVGAAAKRGFENIRSARVAEKAAIDAAKTTTGARGAILRYGDAIGSAVGRLSGAASSAAGTVSKFVTEKVGVNLPGVKEAAKAVYGMGAGSKSKAIRYSTAIPRAIVHAPAAVGSKAASAVGKTGAAVLGGIESLGSKVFTGRGLIGGLGRTMTAAKSNAVGFAVGSWIDAGLEAYDFFKEGGGKDTAGPIKWFGKGKDPSDPDGVFSNPEFYRSYFAEVGKKLQSTITFGFFGDDNGVIDRFFGNDEESVKARDKARQDAFDASVEADPVIAEYRRMQKTHRDRMGAATALPAGYLSPEMGVRRYISDLSAERDKALSREGLTDRGRENLEKKYAGYIGEALKNEASKIISDQNRAQYYGLVTGGRDYAKDYELSGKDPNAVRGFSEFNERWGKFSDEDKVLYNHEEARAAFDEARRRRMMGEGN